MFKKRRAFTLVELLVAVAIIGILATLAVVALQQARSRARDSKRVADIKQIQTALELFFNEYNRYPSSNEWSSNVIGTSTNNIYMHSIPEAPKTIDGDCEMGDYIYSLVDDGLSYQINFCIGRQVSDLPAGNLCASPGGINYCGIQDEEIGETITYILNFDAQGGTVNPLFKEVVYNQAIGELPIPTREYYVFLEWNTQADGSGDTYESNTIYINENNSIIYAIWEFVCEGAIPFEGLNYNLVEALDGKCWLDRNLGASAVGSVGWMYQWGRLKDGHQLYNSNTTTILSSSTNPGNSNFIINTSHPRNWLNYRDNTLWQGVHGGNNPCPPDFRVPTIFEWQNFVSAENISNNSNAYNSSLKLPSYKERYSSGSYRITSFDEANYWSSSPVSSYPDYSYYLRITHEEVYTTGYTFRATGFTVRCIRN
ncbi:MAG: InlB B-repeat-containing protein [Patescibacteria group bacterium]|nr:InlB B-repeat-containing protein [Patescibacteria group bacterium]